MMLTLLLHSKSNAKDVYQLAIPLLYHVDLQHCLQVDFFQQESTRINPGIPIPAAATAVHRITQDMLRGCPRFAALSNMLYGFMDGCDLAGCNVRWLVVPMLT